MFLGVLFLIFFFFLQFVMICFLQIFLWKNTPFAWLVYFLGPLCTYALAVAALFQVEHASWQLQLLFSII